MAPPRRITPTRGLLLRPARSAGATHARGKPTGEAETGAAGGLRVELSSDEWEAVCRQLGGGAEGCSWRGVMRAVCRAARVGVDGCAAVAQDGGREMDVRVFATRVKLLAWAEAQGFASVDDERVLQAAVEGGWLAVLGWGWDSRGWGRWARKPPRAARWAAGAGQLSTLQWLTSQGLPVDE